MTHSGQRVALALACILLHAASACAGGQATPARAITPLPRPGVVADTNASGLIPAGYGSLKQDDVAIKFQLPDVLLKMTPLEENVIRALSVDSYRALHGIAESHKAAVARQAAQHGQLHGSLWYVSFYGLAPDARFSPQEVTIKSAGQEYRPLEILPLTGGFGEQRLQPRMTQTALYLFDDGLDVNQPLVVTFGTERNEGWSGILTAIERERALVRSRAASSPAPKLP
ncbi:MAG: hypothetical protein ABJE47_06625 [bacterium]